KLLYGLGIGCSTRAQIKKFQKSINHSVRAASKTTHRIINEALAAPVEEAGGGVYDLQQRFDAKLLHDTEVRLSRPEDIVGQATRSRLFALQQRWAVQGNPLEQPPGRLFASDGEARSSH